MTDKYTLITQNVHEFIGDTIELQNIINERPLKVYFGTAPTGKIHIGYFIPLLKLIDLIDAECSVKILLADLHAFLDARKSSLSDLNFRTDYYKEMISSILEVLGVSKEKIDSIQFIKGTSYQLSKEYNLDVYKALSLVSLHDAKHAGADVVRQTENPMMNSLIYPTLQALDEEYLDIDLELSGIDQRKIVVHSRSIMPQLGYKKRMYLMTPMLPALSTTKMDISVKMSSSEMSKIDLLDDEKTISKKIKSVYCLEGDIKDNSLLILSKMILFPTLIKLNKTFIIKRSEKYGGDIQYYNYEDLETDFGNKKLHPSDLKKAISEIISNLLKPIRIKFSQPYLVELIKKAYN